MSGFSMSLLLLICHVLIIFPRNFNSPFLIQIISVHFHWNIVVAQVICLWYSTHSLGLKGIPSMSLSEDFPIKTSAPRVTGIIGVFMYHIVSRFPLQIIWLSSILFKYLFQVFYFIFVVFWRSSEIHHSLQELTSQSESTFFFSGLWSLYHVD